VLLAEAAAIGGAAAEIARSVVLRRDGRREVDEVRA
jgi:hypothetical protein